jgi:hypothetical protein
MIRRWLGFSLILIALMVSTGSAQEVYFGKNKVQYKNLDWNYIQTRHFDIYFYEDAYSTAKFAAEVLEASYTKVTDELNYRIQRRVPVFIYNSQNDFQQTNIISSLIPEGVGGFTEAFKNRIVVPFTGSYEDFRHVLHHELTHAVVYDLLYGNFLGSLLSQRRLFSLPTWYAEGYAEFSSRDGWDYFSDMYIRDATINAYLQPPEYLDGFLAYKQGQAMVKYIVDTYGEAKLGEILQKGKIHLTMAKTLKASLGVSEDDFYEAFAKEMKRRYWPEIALRKEANEVGKQLTHAQKDGSYLNEHPVFSPEGDRLAIFSDVHDYTEILMISALDGKVLERLVKGERSGDIESLHSYVSGMSFSPSGRSLAFVAKSGGQDALLLLDVAKKDIYRKKQLGFYNVLSPSWSPDSTRIAFSATDSNKRDLFVYNLLTDQVQQITDDRYDDLDPTWMPNSSALVFCSDRPHPGTPAMDHLGQPNSAKEVDRPGDFRYGDYDLFSVDLASRKVTAMEVGPGSNHNPSVSPDGKKVAFISNRNGIDNIYVSYMDSARTYAVTDILTGAQSVSWAPDGQRLAFAAFQKGAFDIFVMKDLVPVGDNGMLKPTDYVLGKYNVPDKSKDKIAEKASGVLAQHAKAATTDTVKADTSPIKADTSKLAATTDTSRTAAAPAVTDTTSKKKADTTRLAATGDTTRTGAMPAATDTTSKKKDSLVTSTGVYGDEYVHVGEKPKKKDALDSLMTDIKSDTAGGSKTPLPEPASFDSVPGPLPSGEYSVHKYKVQFTPDFVGGGFNYDTFFGLQGQSYFLFSDYLGNQQIYIATDLVNTIDQSNVQAFYLNYTKRWNWGGGIFHTKNYYVDPNDNLFSDRFYGFQFMLSRPSSIYSRVELVGAQFFIDRKYYFNNPSSPVPPDRSSKVTTFTLSYVTDNILWGETGPVNGKRAKFSVQNGVNLFDSRDISFYSSDFDYRTYWHIGRGFSAAFRVSGGASFGSTPKLYFLGGTTNWIGTRTLDAKVYNVENLYFADVVTPLRGVPYYGLSGTRFGLINFEFRYPLIQVLALRFPLPLVISHVQGALFTDIGSAWYGNQFKGGTSENGKSRLQDIHTGFGVGMRANLFGFAVLRYDLAWSTDLSTVSAKPSHYFSFGADF